MCFPMRLKPGQEIKEELIKFVSFNNLQAAFVMTCVGSVTKATLRMADSKSIKSLNGPFEIVSLVGTLSQGGHLHISLSDSDGNVVGGHVIGDLIVNTTAEVMVGECCDATFTREPDSDTGYDELVVNRK